MVREFRDRRDGVSGGGSPAARRSRSSGTPVKCGITKPQQYRAVTTRYDKLAVRYEATVQFAAVHIWPRHS